MAAAHDQEHDLETAAASAAGATFEHLAPVQVAAPVAVASLAADAVDPSVGLWSAALSALAGKVSTQNFELWFRPIQCQSIVEKIVALRAPNRFIKEWFETHYLGIVLDELQKSQGQAFTATWELSESPGSAEPPLLERPRRSASRSAAARPAAPAAPAVAASPPQSRQSARAALLADTSQPPAQAPELLDKYTFDSFVIGPSNQLAEAASRAVAENPAGKYNPLFIYGGVGLGKTHLLHAIGHHLHRAHPHWRIVYLKTETFMNEYINLVRTNRIDEFRTKYRDNTDVLLMDDIQYLGGKERTQDEFFHTFNALFESHRQIVVTADKYPHEIPDLEERIRSRFQWGLIADIQAPELETRIAILSKKAEQDGIELPTEVAHFLAAHIKSNVRELEGLLIRVAAFASLKQQPITVAFVQETLKSFLGQQNAHLTVESVQREVANYFGVTIADLRSSSRQAAVARPRMIAMYLARKLCKSSYPDLGQRFGGKDHTTVMSACRKIEALSTDDAKVRDVVQELERQLSR